MDKPTSLEEKLDKANEDLKECIAQLGRLPRGSLQISRINGTEYVYLRFRKDGKSTSTYVGKKDSPAALRAERDANKAKLLKSEMKLLRSEIKRLKKEIRILSSYGRRKQSSRDRDRTIPLDRT